MKLRDRLKGLAVAALVGAGSVLVRFGLRIDGVEPGDELGDEAPFPAQDPITDETRVFIEEHRPPRGKTLDVRDEPLRGSAAERYARARQRITH